MFREPEDEEVLLAGWPWHGLIRNDVLTLPSGRTLDIAYAERDTSLWDIGLPDPPFETDDPDVEWWGRAIIRGGRYFYSGGNRQWVPTQLAFAQPPVYVGGVVRRARDLGLKIVNTGGGVYSIRVELYVDDVRYQSNILLSSDFGVPTVSNFGGNFLDHRWDRGRWLAFVGDNERRMGLLEARLTGSGSGLSLELTVLAVASEFWEPEIFSDEPVNIPESGRINSGVYDFAPLPGRYSARRTARLLDTAFYRLDATVERVYLYVNAESIFETTDVSVTPNIRKWINSGELWLQGDSLGATSAVSFEASYEHTVNPDGIHPARRVDKINGVEVRAVDSVQPGVNYSFLFGDVPAWFTSGAINTSLDWQLGGASAWGSNLRAYAMRTSNNIYQARVSAQFFPPPSGIRVDVVSLSSALTPSGVDPGEAFFDTRVPGDYPGGVYEALFRFETGSYNPVTGQVMRNSPYYRYSWV